MDVRMTTLHSCGEKPLKTCRRRSIENNQGLRHSGRSAVRHTVADVAVQQRKPQKPNPPVPKRGIRLAPPPSRRKEAERGRISSNWTQSQSALERYPNGLNRLGDSRI